MTWQHEPWTQDDTVLGGLPYTVEPPAPYSISGVKTVWHWSRKVLDGLPYTVAPPERWGFRAICVGDTRVRAVYRGETLVWAVGMARQYFPSLSAYLDYYFDPARAAVWEREGFAAYLAGLWGLTAALAYTDTVDTSEVRSAAGTYLYDGKTYHGVVAGHLVRHTTTRIPMIRAQHFTVTLQITPDAGQAQNYIVHVLGSAPGKIDWMVQRSTGERLRCTLSLETTGILESTSFATSAFIVDLYFGIGQTPLTITDGENVSRYLTTTTAGMLYPFGDPVQVDYPAGTVTARTRDAYIRDAYNAYYLQQYPALADVIFIPPEITLGTWDDLAVLTWDDASAYTWNEIGGN